jgi:hypothetical protein
MKDKMVGLELRGEPFYQLLHRALRVSAFVKCYQTAIAMLNFFGIAIAAAKSTFL